MPPEPETETDASPRYVLRTLGCKANLVDSQGLEAELQRKGWQPSGGAGDAALCIINSCTVTDEADLQSRKLASRLARENPGARVVITGCAAEVDPERLARSKGVSYVVGNQDKPALVEMVLERTKHQTEPTGEGEVLGSVQTYSHILSRHPLDREWPSVQPSKRTDLLNITQGRLFTATTRAFLKVQEGCNTFCTYCIIPYGRGPSRSLPVTDIVAQIRALVGQGILEVVITGTNIGHYGSDFGESAPGVEPPLTELFERVLGETGLRRLRVSSLDPTEITPGLLRLMEREPRFCPHFHVSVQSVSDKILRLMKRRYAAIDVSRCLERLATIRTAQPGGVYVGMDLITGFPGETEADFEECVKFLERHRWSRLHVFPYSEREGTPATRLPGSVPQPARVARSRRLNALSLGRLTQVYEGLLATGARLEGALLERGSGVTIEGVRYRAGYTPGYLRALVPDTGAAPPGVETTVRPRSLHVQTASGEVSFLAETLPAT